MSITLRLGETAPERNGAGISEIIRSTSSSSNVLLCCASCSQDRMEPRSLPCCRAFGRKNGELSVDEGGAGEAYERFARLGRKPERDGVCGLPPVVPCRRALGIAGVGADGETTDPSMNSTSSASMLSMLLSCVIILGVGVAGTDAPRVWMTGAEPPGPRRRMTAWKWQVRRRSMTHCSDKGVSQSSERACDARKRLTTAATGVTRRPGYILYTSPATRSWYSAAAQVASVGVREEDGGN